MKSDWVFSSPQNNKLTVHIMFYFSSKKKKEKRKQTNKQKKKAEDYKHMQMLFSSVPLDQSLSKCRLGTKEPRLHSIVEMLQCGAMLSRPNYLVGSKYSSKSVAANILKHSYNKCAPQPQADLRESGFGR